MSYSDYYDEDWDFSDVHDWHEDGYWTTQEGDHIKFEDLENYHLMNIENLLRRKGLLDEWPEITEQIELRKLYKSDVPLVERLKF